MAAWWQERVRAAEQARFEASTMGRLLAGLGISTPSLRRLRVAKNVLVWLAWAFVTRKVKLVVGGAAAAGLILVAALVAAAVLVFAQLA